MGELDEIGPPDQPYGGDELHEKATEDGGFDDALKPERLEQFQKKVGDYEKALKVEKVLESEGKAVFEKVEKTLRKGSRSGTPLTEKEKEQLGGYLKLYRWYEEEYKDTVNPVLIIHHNELKAAGLVDEKGKLLDHVDKKLKEMYPPLSESDLQSTKDIIASLKESFSKHAKILSALQALERELESGGNGVWKLLKEEHQSAWKKLEKDSISFEGLVEKKILSRANTRVEMIKDSITKGRGVVSLTPQECIELGLFTKPLSPNMETVELNQIILQEQFNAVLGDESIGGNAGPGNSAVNMAVREDGSIAEVGNFQNLTTDTQQDLRRGALLNVTIRRAYASGAYEILGVKGLTPQGLVTIKESMKTFLGREPYAMRGVASI